MIETHLPILVIALPLAAAPLCVLLGHRRLTRLLALLVSWVTFAISVMLLTRVWQDGPLTYELGGWESPYGIVYVIDYLSAFVMLFVSGLAALALTWSPPSIEAEIPHSKHYLFHTTWLLCLTGLLGICATGDLFNVFVFLEISSLSTYALVALGKSRRARLAAFRYLVTGTIGATFMLIGIGLLYQLTGTLNMADMAERLQSIRVVEGLNWAGSRTILVAFAFLTVGLFIKMAVFPLHTWLPNAYAYAPSGVTVFIAATATKVSVYAFIRVVFSVFTPEFSFQLLPLGNELMVFSLIGIYVASVAAIFQRNIKRLLAWSSIAQVGYMLLGVSIANAAGLTAGILHMFNHALIKGGLFMAVGCFALQAGSNRLDDLRGVGRTMPWTSLAWVIGGLGLIGVPLTAGFASKWLLLTAAVDSHHWTLAVLMLVSSLLAVVYVWRVVEIMYFSEPSERAAAAREAPWLMRILTWLVIGATLLFGVWTEYPVALATAAAESMLGGTP